MMLLVLLAAQQVEFYDWSGASVTTQGEGTVEVKTAWGRLQVPLSEIDLLRFCRVREEVMADLGAHISRGIALLESTNGDESRKGEAQLIALGHPALAEINAIYQVSLGAKQLGLQRVIQAINTTRPSPHIDVLSGPSLFVRGWVTSESIKVGAEKRLISSLCLVHRHPMRDLAGPLLVRMTDGTILSGKFTKGTLRVGATDVVLANLRQAVIAPGGKAVVEADRKAEGKLDGTAITLETAFGPVELPLKALAAVMRADWSPFEGTKPDKDGYLREWLMYGNIAMEGDNFDAGHLDVLDESTVVPSPNEEMFGRKWIKHESPRNDINILEALPKERVDNFVCYGALYIKSSKAQAVVMHAQSDDGIKAWLNGELVHNNHVHRGLGAWTDQVSVTLQAGWNRLLIKVDNGGGPSGWRIRFVDSRNKGVTDLALSMRPPAIFLGR
jgi:hypothetical protein